MSTYIHNIEEIADRYDAFILDIFGVLHNGIEPFPDTKRTLEALRNAGKATCLLSNSPRRAHNASNQMDDMDLHRGLYDHIVTSGESTHDDLKAHYQGQNCWMIGKTYIEEVVEGLSITPLDGPDGADFILNAIPGTSPPEVADFKTKLEIALARDIPMICANPDLVVHVGDTLYECAGTFAKMYEDIGGRVIYHGKPHAPVYERCYHLLGAPEKSRICAIGDSLHTDVAGANGFGIDCILNLAGIHREEITPDTLDHIDDQPHKPDYLIHGFCW